MPNKPMKSSAYFIYLAAVAAFVALPLQVEVTASFVVAAGLGLLLAHDSREPRGLRLPRRPRQKLRARFFPPALLNGTHRITA